MNSTTGNPMIRKGARIETSGWGRTARWPYGTGTVTMVRKNRVYVHWDGTHFEDEMDAGEIRLIARQTRAALA